MRRTEQRTVILEELRRAADHPAADDVYLRVKGRLPHVSLSTVYRNLELLAGEGLIRKIEYGSGQKRFDPVAETHSHFHCAGCGRLEDLPFTVELPELDSDHPWVREREIHGGRPDYYGFCPSCSGNRSASEGDRPPR